MIARRVFLKILGLGAGGAALGLGTWSCSKADDDSLADSRDKAQLTEDELDELVVLSIALFEPEDERTRSELDATIRWWAKGRTIDGPHLAIYRNGLAAEAGESREALKDELLEGIYSTAIGWKSLGYTTLPGVPSGPLEYTTRPHGPPRVVSALLAETPG